MPVKRSVYVISAMDVGDQNPTFPDWAKNPAQVIQLWTLQRKLKVHGTSPVWYIGSSPIIFFFCS